MINEKELIREIENDEWKPVKNIEEENNKLKKAVKDRKEETNIKLSENNINLILSESSLKKDWLSLEEDKVWEEL